MQRLGARATLKLLQEADHSFHVRASSGRRDPDVRQELILALVDWIDGSLMSETKQEQRKLKIAAAISLSFTGIVVLILTLLVKGVVTFQLATADAGGAARPVLRLRRAHLRLSFRRPAQVAQVAS